MNIRSLTLASQHTDTRILLAKAEGVRATLERRNITNVAIVCREMGAFAPAFLGAARQGATIHLLPNTQEGTVIHVAKGGLVILHDDREHAGDAAVAAGSLR